MFARLGEQAKDASTRSMESQMKRSSGPRSKRRNSKSCGCRSSGIDIEARMAVATEFACVSMEEFVDRNARNEWVEQMKLHVAHPTLADHHRLKDAWVKSGITQH